MGVHRKLSGIEQRGVAAQSNSLERAKSGGKCTKREDIRVEVDAHSARSVVEHGVKRPWFHQTCHFKTRKSSMNCGKLIVIEREIFGEAPSQAREIDKVIAPRSNDEGLKMQS